MKDYACPLPPTPSLKLWSARIPGRFRDEQPERERLLFLCPDARRVGNRPFSNRCGQGPLGNSFFKRFPPATTNSLYGRKKTVDRGSSRTTFESMRIEGRRFSSMQGKRRLSKD